MWNWRIITGGFALFSVYTIFWFWYFDSPKAHKDIVSIPQKQSSFSLTENSNLVLGDESISIPPLPLSYKIFLDPRRQFFNLSCEFASAASVLFHFTNNPDFAVANEVQAEKKLINKAWISRNPNVGIRMGYENLMDIDTLYSNLNKWFGGSDYYGIHAPPFIDLFADYHLKAKPIYINDAVISSIQKAISEKHLVMAWIKIGYSKPIDDFLSYGKVKIVRGEHSVVINGYDEKGVVMMDPAIGLERYVEYASLLDAASFFPMPFLEVYVNSDNKNFLDNLTIGFDTMTGIDRSIPKIYVQNGSTQIGAANQMWDILKDFGYNTIPVGNAENLDYQDVTIQAKKNFTDFSYILKRDIKIASFAVASFSADLSDDFPADAVVIVGN